MEVVAIIPSLVESSFEGYGAETQQNGKGELK